MTTTDAPGARTAALTAKAGALADALAVAGERVDPAIARRAHALLAGVRERLALGVDHTVVALVGGTGSGKSSVFNALTGLDFADVGVRRPTTSEVAACVWAHDATALLDWLGVRYERRIERESALDGESQADLRGLVLLDLPDHDSVEPEHREVVDRLLPMVDLLVWVVDPQKYADDALHSGYLRDLVGHEAAMLVLLNQVDTVPPAALPGLLDDVARLLREDGLVDVATFPVSARTGDGLREVRGVLAQAVTGRGVAELRAAAELADAAAAVAGAVGPSEQDPPRELAVDALADAAGLAGMVAATVAAVRSGRPVAGAEPGVPPRLGPVQADRVALVRAAWLAQVGADLPDRWRDALEVAAPDGAALVDRLDAGVRGVEIPGSFVLAASRLRLVALVAAVVGLGLGVAAFALDGAARVGVGVAAVAVLLTGAGLLLAARSCRARAARGRAAALDRDGREVVARVVDELDGPTAQVLRAHAALRTAVATARRAPGTTDEVSSTP